MKYESTLCHFGILGQKWGERRFQNEDGTLTEAGKERYSKEVREAIGRHQKKLDEDQVHNWVTANNRISRAWELEHLGDDFNKAWKASERLTDAHLEAADEWVATLIDHELTKVYAELANNSEDVKKAMDLIEKYKMYEWDDFSRKAVDDLKELNELANSPRPKYKRER